jgi:hypothetical protein
MFRKKINVWILKMLKNQNPKNKIISKNEMPKMEQNLSKMFLARSFLQTKFYL